MFEVSIKYKEVWKKIITIYVYEYCFHCVSLMLKEIRVASNGKQEACQANRLFQTPAIFLYKIEALEHSTATLHSSVHLSFHH